MKLIFVVLPLVTLSICVLPSKSSTVAQDEGVLGVPGGYHKYKLTNKDYLNKYKDILELFKYLHQPTYSKKHIDFAKEYNIEHNLSKYTNVEAAKEFLKNYHRGMLPRDEIFSVFYDDHLKQAISLFKLFYYAKDFDAFYKTACWARYHLNQGMFLYSFSVALIHRYDTYSMVLPPIYEIYPYYFFNAEVLQKAQYYKQVWTAETQQQHEYYIAANYSGWYLNLHPEQSMSYFTEDIGINAYYYYYNLYRPFWMKAEEFDIHKYNRGEEFYYFYQQLLARYYLERLSNDFGEIGSYDYKDPFEIGYHSSLRYPNGLPFPERSNWAQFFTNYYNYKQSYSVKEKYGYSFYKVLDYERRIRDAIDLGYIYTETGERLNIFEPRGFNALGNIIEGNVDSSNRRFYGDLQLFARHLLGYSYQPLSEYKLAPSALEHFETSLRDPAFWMFYKRIILYFQKYKSYLPQYTYDDLTYDGVKIEDVEIDRLVTYFENYNVDLSNGVYVNPVEFEQNSFEVYGRQYRLNHKPFTYKIKVISDKATQAVVRVFIGPKYDEYGRLITIEENRMNFVEFDRFKYDIKSGLNLIERNSHQIFYASDKTTYKQLYQYTLSGISGGQDFLVHGSEVYYAFPNRFLLPKGKYGGQTYQFYVIISPYRAPASFDQKQQQNKQIYEKLHEGYEYEYFKYPMVGLGVQYLDDYPLGYPFDRPIDEYSFYVPNSHFKDVIVYHKHQDDVNRSTFEDNSN